TAKQVGGINFALYPDDQQAAETDSDTPTLSCRDGEAVSGLSGRYGDHVNALGINCKKYPPDPIIVGPTPKKTEPQTPFEPTKAMGMIFCQGGGMPVGTGAGNLSIMIGFRAAPQSAQAAIPARGECAWSDRPIAENEPKAMYVPLGKDAKSLVDAAQQGGI